MRCRDLLCHHAESSHGELDGFDGLGPCRLCSCGRFRLVVPRHQQLKRAFSKKIAAGETFVDWLSIPDPTAERKPGRGIETVGYL